MKTFIQYQQNDGTVLELPIRKAYYESLPTEAERLTYATQCAEYHAPTGPNWKAVRDARRAYWDDQDRLDAETLFQITPIECVNDEIRVEIRHHGRLLVTTVPNSTATLEATARSLFSTYEQQLLANESLLDKFSLTSTG